MKNVFLKTKAVLLASISFLACAALSDVIVSNITTKTVTPVTIEQTNIVEHAEVKLVWTSFSVNYIPPHYTQSFYRVSYHMVDTSSKEIIPNSRKTISLKDDEMFTALPGQEDSVMTIWTTVGDLINAFLMLDAAN